MKLLYYRTQAALPKTAEPETKAYVPAVDLGVTSQEKQVGGKRKKLGKRKESA